MPKKTTETGPAFIEIRGHIIDVRSIRMVTRDENRVLVRFMNNCDMTLTCETTLQAQEVVNSVNERFLRAGFLLT